MLRSVLKETLLSLTGRATGKAAPSRDSSVAAAEARLEVESMPNSAEARVQLGVALKAAGRLAEAEAAFRYALTLHGDNVVAHYNLGVVLAETKRPWEAEEAFRNALSLLPNFVEAYINLSVLLLRQKRFVDAEAALRRALELKPDLIDARHLLAETRAETERLARIIAECRLAVEAEPRSPGPCLKLGAILIEARRPVEAAAAFRSAIDLGGNSPSLLYHLGAALGQSGRLSQAETALRHALELDADYIAALQGLGAILLRTYRAAEAEAVYRRVIRLRPDDAETHNNLGIALKNLNQPLEAETAFRRAESLQPDFEQASRNLYLIRKEIDRLRHAEAGCRREAELGSGSVALYCRLGSTLMALGRLDEALMNFQRAVALGPPSPDALRQLAAALTRKQRIEEAVECCLRAISIRRDSPKLLTSLGTAYALKGDLEQAIQCFVAALALEPHQVETNQAMVATLMRQGRGDEAIEYFERGSRKPSVYVEHGAQSIRTVLLLWTPRTGNVPTMELLFPRTINTRINWVIESPYDDGSADLPEYDLAFNAMGDRDLIGEAAEPLARFADACDRPLLNRPEQVALTARDQLPRLLGGIEDVVVPTVWRFSSGTDWDESVADYLPLLVRPVDSHGGKGLVLAKTASELAACRTSQSGPVYVCPFMDYRSGDSWFRKYRMIFVDTHPYPYHLAISQNWMVHYANADMEAHPWKLAEELVFLLNPEAVLGHAGMEAMHSIGTRMDLEYAGIDFAILRDKRVLVFEANPTMLVHPEGISGPLQHKNLYVFGIQKKFEEMLGRVCQAPRLHSQRAGMRSPTSSVSLQA